MKKYFFDKKSNSFKNIVSLICALVLAFGVFQINIGAQTEKYVTATTSASVRQGSSAVCYVYIDSTESLAALDVTVHFDPEKIVINNIYNNIGCTMYDSVQNTDNVQFSYILDGKGSNSKTRLFYFYYQVISTAEAGEAYFDITVGEAYDSALKNVAVSGSRCAFTVTKAAYNKSCSVYSSSSIATKVEQEFTLNYRFSTYQIASGTAEVTYDPELFEVVEVENGDFLTDKLADINTSLAGTVYISFVGTQYNTKYDLVSIKFKTLKNADESSDITFNAKELCTKELDPISCSTYKTAVNISFDSSYLGDAPQMRVLAQYDEAVKKLTAKIVLEKNSRLGAGDFVLTFDPDILTLVDYEKGFTPSFFNINDKQLEEGLFKFSIISIEDITTAENVLTLSFDVNAGCAEKTATLDIEGSGLSDSLTEPIKLNLIDAAEVISACHECSDNGVCLKCGELCAMLGDTDLDGVITLADIVLMRKALIGTEIKIEDSLGVYDTDTNTCLDIRDLVRLKKTLIGI